MAFPFITTPRRGSCVMKTIDGYRTTALSEWGAIQPIAGGRSNAIPSPMVSEITIQSEGATFAPVIVLNSGYTLGVNATALWTFADASTDATLTPSKNYGSAASRANTLVVTPWAALRRINVGYGGEDGGSVDIEHVTQQNVSAITGLVAARAGLKELCINGSLVTSIAISSLSNLVTLECYEGSLISLSPPASIKRLCVENNDIAGTLNLAHCSALEDLRAALNLCETIILPTVAPNLWHICIRNNPNLVLSSFDFSRFSALLELLIWSINGTGALTLPASAWNVVAYGNSFTSLVFPGGAVHVLDMTGNALADVDAIINKIAGQEISDGTLRIAEGTNAEPTSASAAALSELTAAGWTLTYNSGESHWWDDLPAFENFDDSTPASGFSVVDTGGVLTFSQSAQVKEGAGAMAIVHNGKSAPAYTRYAPNANVFSIGIWHRAALGLSAYGGGPVFIHAQRLSTSLLFEVRDERNPGTDARQFYCDYFNTPVPVTPGDWYFTTVLATRNGAFEYVIYDEADEIVASGTSAFTLPDYQCNQVEIGSYDSDNFPVTTYDDQFAMDNSASPIFPIQPW